MTARLFTLLSFAALAFACSDGDNGASAPASVPSAGTTPVAGTPAAWSAKAPLPTPRSEVASAVLDAKLYVIAGFNAQGASTNVVEVYDPASDTWQRLASLPQARDHAMAAAHGGKVYVFGGGLAQATNTAFAFDPVQNAWSRVANMPYRRTAGGAAVLNDRIIVVGGTGDSPETSMVYDSAMNRWADGPRLPAPREHLAVTGTGTAVYILGGRWNNQLMATNEVLDSLTGAFRTLAPMPTARGGTAGGVAAGRIVVAGGEAFEPSRTFPQVEVYDPATNTWSAAPNLPTPRHGLAVQGVGDVIYVIGGGPTAGLSVAPQNEALPIGR
jgi:hypothetical protein